MDPEVASMEKKARQGQSHGFRRSAVDRVKSEEPRPMYSRFKSALSFLLDGEFGLMSSKVLKDFIEDSFIPFLVDYV